MILHQNRAFMAFLMASKLAVFLRNPHRILLQSPLLATYTLLLLLIMKPATSPVDASDDSNGEVEPIDSWEEEDEAEAEVGDGGDGGGVLNNCPWGERALSIAREVLQEFGKEMQLNAFKTSPRGYIYVRLDKLSNEYGCPSMEGIF